MGLISKSYDEQPDTVPSQPVCNYLKLNEEDFKCLVRGGVLHVGKQLRIILSDIGYEQMLNAIDSATQGIDIYKDHLKNE
jgi:hypothetical protein